MLFALQINLISKFDLDDQRLILFLEMRNGLEWIYNKKLRNKIIDLQVVTNNFEIVFQECIKNITNSTEEINNIINIFNIVNKKQRI